MEWTKEKPKEPGWYWLRSTGRPNEEAEVVRLYPDGEFFFAENECGFWVSAYNPEAEWAGPLFPQDEWIKCEDQTPPSLDGNFLLFLPLCGIRRTH